MAASRWGVVGGVSSLSLSPARRRHCPCVANKGSPKLSCCRPENASPKLFYGNVYRPPTCHIICLSLIAGSVGSPQSTTVHPPPTGRHCVIAGGRGAVSASHACRQYKQQFSLYVATRAVSALMKTIVVTGQIAGFTGPGSGPRYPSTRVLTSLENR